MSAIMFNFTSLGGEIGMIVLGVLCLAGLIGMGVVIGRTFCNNSEELPVTNNKETTKSTLNEVSTVDA